jgi:SAM-dependent methyltransferase
MSIGEGGPAVRAGKWPKTFSPLSQEEEAISHDWMKHFHTAISTNFERVERFNHGYPIRHTPPEFESSLEIGAGVGGHYAHELRVLTPRQAGNYYAVEIRPNMAEELSRRYPKVKVYVGDCQQRMPFAEGFFDRIIANNVLEHLPNLPECLKEVRRLLNPDRGVFSVIIPCEGGLGYSLGRAFTSKRQYEKRYRKPYADFIRRDHVNTAREVLEELRPLFDVAGREFWPLRVPFVALNLFMGITLTPPRPARRR